MKFFECQIYSEGVNYSVRRGRNQQQVEIKNTTLEIKYFKWIIGNTRNNNKVIVNSSKRNMTAQRKFKNWDPRGMPTSTRHQ